MKKLLFYNALLFLLVLSSCKDDDSEEFIDFSVSFSSDTVSLSEDDTVKEITLSYSRAASEDGTIVINYTAENAAYGTDFTTSPAGDSGSITIPVAIGDINKTFSFTKLLDPIEGTTKSVTFSISNFDDTSWVKGSTSTALVSFTPIAALSGVIDVELGGSNEPNQVYIDLSTGQQTAVKRDTWELAFYNGTENRVFLNSSLLVSAAEITGETDLLAVTESTVLENALDLYTIDQNFAPLPVTVTTVAELVAGLEIGYDQYGDEANGLVFTDSKAGDISKTAFAEISTTAEENYVYIVGLGNSIPTEPAADLGSLATTGEHRGFMKVRILTDGNTYTIQYASLEETSAFSEFTITKDDTYIQTAFSLSTENTVDVEPVSVNWDLNFSGIFSYYTGGYGLTYSDYSLHNTLGNVGLYQVTTYETVDDVQTDFDVPSYNAFSRGDVDESALIYDDKTIIGSSWRSVNIYTGVLSIKDDRFYILKDGSGNFYKIKFTAAKNSEGERGYPQFVYERL